MNRQTQIHWEAVALGKRLGVRHQLIEQHIEHLCWQHCMPLPDAIQSAWKHFERERDNGNVAIINRKDKKRGQG